MEDVDLRVWSALSEIPEQDCAVELAEAYLDNRVNLSPPWVANLPFNITAYGNKVKRNRRLCTYSKSYNLLHISSDSDSDELEPYCISEAEVSLAANQVDAYSGVDDADELEYAIRKLDAMYVDLLIVYRVDFWLCLKLALAGMPEPVEKLRNMAEDNARFSSLLRILLSGASPAVSRRLADVG